MLTFHDTFKGKIVFPPYFLSEPDVSFLYFSLLSSHNSGIIKKSHRIRIKHLGIIAPSGKVCLHIYIGPLMIITQNYVSSNSRNLKTYLKVHKIGYLKSKGLEVLIPSKDFLLDL